MVPSIIGIIIEELNMLLCIHPLTLSFEISFPVSFGIVGEISQFKRFIDELAENMQNTKTCEKKNIKHFIVIVKFKLI